MAEIGVAAGIARRARLERAAAARREAAARAATSPGDGTTPGISASALAARLRAGIERSSPCV